MAAVKITSDFKKEVLTEDTDTICTQERKHMKSSSEPKYISCQQYEIEECHKDEEHKR